MFTGKRVLNQFFVPCGIGPSFSDALPCCVSLDCRELGSMLRHGAYPASFQEQIPAILGAPCERRTPQPVPDLRPPSALQNLGACKHLCTSIRASTFATSQQCSDSFLRRGIAYHGCVSRLVAPAGAATLAPAPPRLRRSPVLHHRPSPRGLHSTATLAQTP